MPGSRWSKRIGERSLHEHYLNLHDNQLNSEYRIKALTEVLCNNISLKSLIIYDNALDLREVKTLQRLGGANAIAKLIFENTGLTSLDLSCNEFGSKSDIRVTLYEHYFETLNLYYNLIDYNGGKAIIETLCKKRHTDSIEKAIARVLVMNTTLNSVNLQNNSIGFKISKDISYKHFSNTFGTFR
ncbi:hypothetical protein C2G38_2247150 [Gigaspora rosea]|uniref:Uncharacterized protein n=1 Tax=Gigaspora rosea TaxID=44941 RepID=A0A397V5N8_9GLOM|nr:hypothetical protein C2G38_2247150 [Gigaspora rosea]